MNRMAPDWPAGWDEQFRARVMTALDEAEPVAAVRAVVVDFRCRGLPRERLRQELAGIAADRAATGEPAVEDALLDVMDLLSGWCAPGTEIL